MRSPTQTQTILHSIIHIWYFDVFFRSTFDFAAMVGVIQQGFWILPSSFQVVLLFQIISFHPKKICTWKNCRCFRWITLPGQDTGLPTRKAWMSQCGTLAMWTQKKQGSTWMRCSGPCTTDLNASKKRRMDFNNCLTIVWSAFSCC